jgi:hypothetical protein
LAKEALPQTNKTPFKIYESANREGHQRLALPSSNKQREKTVELPNSLVFRLKNNSKTIVAKQKC